MILDFKEIPQANSSKGLQDTFELFTRDFLEYLGYEIIVDPSRGSDGKKDLIVEEKREGVGGTTYLKWLVSCKHNAFSGKSVSDTDEPDITDRVKKHKCQGFIGVYSTLPSTALSSKFEALKETIEYLVFDREKIEGKLLKTSEGKELAHRYFPKSTKEFIRNHPLPVNLYSKLITIQCDYCGKDLLTTGDGIWVELQNDKKITSSSKRHIHNAYFSCKGECDFILRNSYEKRGFSDWGWLEIDKFRNPSGFLIELFDFIDMVNNDKLYSKAQHKMKLLLKATYPFVIRELMDNEQDLSGYFEDI